LIFLDTNVLSETVRPVPNQRVIDWLKTNDAECVISTVILAELKLGVERLRPNERAKRLIGFPEATRDGFCERTFSFCTESAMIYGKTIGEAARRGHLLSAQDGMIAAIALRHRAALATRNTRDFEGLGLVLINPWK
jgi:predicted nucleic acid-binding protein